MNIRNDKKQFCRAIQGRAEVQLARSFQKMRSVDFGVWRFCRLWKAAQRCDRFIPARTRLKLRLWVLKKWRHRRLHACFLSTACCDACVVGASNFWPEPEKSGAPLWWFLQSALFNHEMLGKHVSGKKGGLKQLDRIHFSEAMVDERLRKQKQNVKEGLWMVEEFFFFHLADFGTLGALADLQSYYANCVAVADNR